MKKSVPISRLRFGVYIHELDRPWTDTPFMFQGFVLNSEKQLETLQKYCKSVIIDTEKGADTPDGPNPFGSSAGALSVLATIKEPVAYEEKAVFKTELPVARQVQAKANVAVRDIFGAIKAGKALDAPRVREAVTSMTDSVVRNPDAMLLLSRMKEKDEQNLDRALGVSVYMCCGRTNIDHLCRLNIDQGLLLT